MITKCFWKVWKPLLQRNNTYYVVGKALDGLEAIDFIEKNKVDIVVTDINMPNMSGYRAYKAD
jgi:YesN/AraC family two-component response regulator